MRITRCAWRLDCRWNASASEHAVDQVQAHACDLKDRQQIPDNRSRPAPTRPYPGFLRRMLGRAMLVSCEVAVEYYLALIHSPQVRALLHMQAPAVLPPACKLPAAVRVVAQ